MIQIKMKPMTSTSRIKVDATKPKESREQAGLRLAKFRMKKLQKRLKSIGNLKAYPLGVLTIEKMCSLIDKWCNEAKVFLRNKREEEREIDI